jgi:excisionase family DNA binding protein
MSLLTVKEASEKLSVGVQRVHQLIKQGTLKAEKLGSYYVIEENQLLNIQIYGKAGRPKKDAVKSVQPKDWDDVISKFAGCLDSGLGDLSTNKKYMEGFGTKEAEKKTLLKRNENNS